MNNKELLADLERRAWERRLWAAARDGVEVAGDDAVHAVLSAIQATLAVTGKAGAKRQPFPEAKVKVAARWLKAVMAGVKPPSLGQLRLLAASRGLEVSRPAIGDWLREEKNDRWYELMAHALAELMNEDDKLKAEQRQRKYDALFDAITQPKKEDEL
jgi:hypothetical protein